MHQFLPIESSLARGPTFISTSRLRRRQRASQAVAIDDRRSSVRAHRKNKLTLTSINDILPLPNGDITHGVGQTLLSEDGGKTTTCRPGGHRGATISYRSVNSPVTTAPRAGPRRGLSCGPPRYGTGSERRHEGLLMWYATRAFGIGSVGWGTLLESPEVDQLRRWARDIP